MVQFDDIKVLTANFFCMVLLGASSINQNLQSVLFFLTILYTLIRTINEIKKYKYKKYGQDSVDSNGGKEEE
jgi:chloramphenicol O-acetyltransferase